MLKKYFWIGLLLLIGLITFSLLFKFNGLELQESLHVLLRLDDVKEIYISYYTYQEGNKLKGTRGLITLDKEAYSYMINYIGNLKYSNIREDKGFDDQVTHTINLVYKDGLQFGLEYCKKKGCLVLWGGIFDRLKTGKSPRKIFYPKVILVDEDLFVTLEEFSNTHEFFELPG